jgi:hypothetical protein
MRQLIPGGGWQVVWCQKASDPEAAPTAVAESITAWVLITLCDGSDYVIHMPHWNPLNGPWWPEEEEGAIGYLAPGQVFDLAFWQREAREHLERQRKAKALGEAYRAKKAAEAAEKRA